MKFAQLNEGKRIVSVGFQGQSIAIEYNASGYDDAIYKESIRHSKRPDDDPRRLLINNSILLRMLTAWDLTEEDCPEECERRKDLSDDPICRTHAIPITAEAIAALPSLLRGRMVTRIMEDAGSGGDDPKANGSS